MTTLHERIEIHSNGGGKRGILVTCSSDAYLDEATEVHDNCAVWGKPELFESKLYGNCKVSGMAAVVRTTASGFVCFNDASWVGDSALQTELGSEINIYDGAVVFHCDIRTPKGTRVEIGGFVQIHNSLIKGSAHLEGQLVIRGCELEPDTWLHRGTWDRPPLMTRTDKWVFSECVPGYIHCQCQCHKMEEWERAGARFGQRFGLTEQEILDCDVAARDLIAKIRARG